MRSTDQKAIVALSGKIPDSPTFFSGSYDGKVNSFTFSETHATCKPVTGAGHSNSIVALSTSDRSEMYTAGMDDSVRIIETSECQFGLVKHFYEESVRLTRTDFLQRKFYADHRSTHGFSS